MKITHEKLEISPGREIAWDEIESLRILNNKLALVLLDHEVIVISNLRPSTMDRAFRFYEEYIKGHPEKRV